MTLAVVYAEESRPSHVTSKQPPKLSMSSVFYGVRDRTYAGLKTFEPALAFLVQHQTALNDKLQHFIHTHKP